MSQHLNTYLALGDSYTIGEGVALHESFPYQTVQLLRKAGLHFNAPEIVAKTGWTSLELAEHILHTQLNDTYDFVTLLIGVNNQYRGLSVDEFTNDFEYLLKKAIHFAGEKAEHVIVLSIPDWGVTPFAIDRDAAKIATEIDRFNKICQLIATKHKCHFINITPSTRLAKQDETLLTTDKLHYSGKEMSKWAKEVADTIILLQKK
jgi:lysophospholipase L1-like esterase